MSNILCLYYSRTGKTRAVMQEIATELGAELVEITDGLDRSGGLGYFMSGIDSMRRGTHRTQPFETKKDLEDYQLVILGTPVWAGRCSSVMRGFLKRHGLELERTAYVLTRGSENQYKDVFRQMDRYTARPRLASTSLQYDSVGYHFWRDQFLTDVRNLLSELPETPVHRKDVTDFVPPQPEKHHGRRS